MSMERDEEIQQLQVSHYMCIVLVNSLPHCVQADCNNNTYTFWEESVKAFLAEYTYCTVV